MVSTSMTHLRAVKISDDQGYGVSLPAIPQQNIIPSGNILSDPKTYEAVESGSGLTRTAAIQIAMAMSAAASLDGAQEREMLFAYVAGAQNLIRPEDPLYEIGAALLLGKDAMQMPSLPLNMVRQTIGDSPIAADSRYIMKTPDLSSFEQSNAAEKPSFDNKEDPLAAFYLAA